MNKLKLVSAVGLFVLFALNCDAQSSKENTKLKQNSSQMKTKSQTFMQESQITWQEAGKGVTRQVMSYDGQLMMVKVKFEKGAIGSPHTHYHTQATYVVSGKFEFTVGDEKKVLNAGDCIYMEPDVLHGCICLEAGMVIDCFSPMRADFIKK